MIYILILCLLNFLKITCWLLRYCILWSVIGYAEKTVLQNQPGFLLRVTAELHVGSGMHLDACTR